MRSPSVVPLLCSLYTVEVMLPGIVSVVIASLISVRACVRGCLNAFDLCNTESGVVCLF